MPETYGAGHLRERIRFEQRTLDDNGDRNGPWAEWFTCSARIQPLHGSEPVQAQRLDGVQPYLITVRASSQTLLIDNSFRAVNARPADPSNPTIYDITAASMTENRTWVECLATWKAGGKG